MTSRDTTYGLRVSGSRSSRIFLKATGGMPTARLVVVALAVVALSCIVLSGRCMAGQYSATAHGNTSTGVQRVTDYPKGNCNQCHSTHGSTSEYYDFGLFADDFGPSKNRLCYTSGCHDSNSTKGVYQGQVVFTASVHNTDPNCYWPGRVPEAKSSADAGNCVNCHDPHGFSDSTGLIPTLNVGREESLCIACHDSNGPALKDIDRQLSKIYTHHIADTVLAARHVAGEDVIGSSYSGSKRHVECPDCHNPHKLPSSVTHTAGTNVASDVLKGTSRVEAQYGSSAWTPPAFAARAPDYVTDIRFEYEVCFKCHSFWAYGSAPPASPSGGVETDQSIEFNPNNKSYHPVVAVIQNNSYTSPTATNGNIETMESPWDNGRHDTMYCTDCHRSEVDSEVKGPHGSMNPYILSAPTGATEDSFCLKCHKASVYQPSTDPAAGETGSRFDEQTTATSGASHYSHMVVNHTHCRDCHSGSESGGSVIEPGSAHGTNRNVGFITGLKIQSYSPGTCLPACHGEKTYTAGPE